MGWRRKGEEEADGLKMGLRLETKIGLGQELGTGVRLEAGGGDGVWW